MCTFSEYFESTSNLLYLINFRGRWSITNDFTTMPFHPILLSAALVGLLKSNTDHILILLFHLFFCLPLHCAFANPEDLETWPIHLSKVLNKDLQFFKLSNGCFNLFVKRLIGDICLIYNIFTVGKNSPPNNK